MSPSLVVMKALFLQKIPDFAGILLPAESTVRSEPCLMKHLLAILRSDMLGNEDLKLLKGYMETY